MMPVLSGFEVCRKIRETRSLYELPILMVTAKQQPEDFEVGFRSGANDFLVKPFEPREFKSRMRSLMELGQSVTKALNAEVAFLQAQIKPHFIFNTLNTIAYFCEAEGRKAGELIVHFSDYLRNSFDFKSSDQYSTIGKEVGFVQTYVQIEQARFGDRLKVEIHVEEDLLDWKVPPLLLQPLVENAILHGILKKVEGGLIRLSIARVGDEMVFKVADPGVGIPANRLNHLLVDNGKRGVGLRNIHTRLQRMYGRGCRSPARSTRARRSSSRSRLGHRVEEVEKGSARPFLDCSV